MATSSGKEGDEHRSRLEVFAGSNPAGYRRWRRRAELFLLALPSNYSKERWGPKLLEFIQGEAEEALEDLSIEKVTAENGYKDILAILDDKYKELQQESLHRGLKEYFYQVMIKPGESYRNFMVRLDTAHRKLAEHGITLPEEVQGWFLMRKLGLDLPSESMVLTATSGSLKKSEVTKAIKAIFPQGKGGAVKRSDVFVLEELGEQGMTGAEAEQPPEEDGQEEVQEIFEIVADQVQQHSDYEEDEALDVFESYRDIKKKVQDKKTSRGFKGSGKAQGKGRARSSGGSSAAASSTTNDVHFTDVLSFNEYQSLDTVAEVLEMDNVTEPKQGDRAKGKQVDSWKVSEDGKELLRVHRKPRKGLFSPAGVLPLKFGSARVDVQVAVLPKGGAHTPLLLSKEFLKWIGAIIDTDTDTLVCKKIGQRIPLAETAQQRTPRRASQPLIAYLSAAMDREYEEITRKMMESLKISEGEKNEVHVPVRDMDDVTDVSEDEPWTPIPGTTKMECGKHGKTQKLTMDQVYKRDKSYVKWVREHVTISSAEGMRKLRLYVARRDSKKAARMKRQVQSQMNEKASSSNQEQSASDPKGNRMKTPQKNAEEQIRMSLMGLRDWRRAAVEQKAPPDVIKDLDEVIKAQEDKLMSMEGRKASTKRPGLPIPAESDMELEQWEQVIYAEASAKTKKKWEGITRDVLLREQTRQANVRKGIREAVGLNPGKCYDIANGFDLSRPQVELPWRKLKMLNVVDMATRYQVCVPLWKGVDARCARVAYRRYWKRWAGSPVKAWTDAGPEFGEYFTSALEGDGTWHEVTASHSPWQNGVVERHGGAWKVAFNKALLGLVLESKMEVEELCDQITQAHNTMTRKGGYSPSQHVFGSEQRVPGLVLTGVHDDVVESGLAVGESAYERRHAIRTAARNAFIDAENEERLKRAAAHRTRPKDGPLSVGELVLVWRKSVGEKKPHWHGPGHVLGVQGSRIWVAHATKVYRCSPEQVKRLSQEQESLVRLLPDDLRTCRNQLRERGAGNIVELDGRDVPPPNFRDGAEGQDEAGEASEEAVAESGPVATQVDGHAEVSASGDAATEVVAEQPPNMEVDTEELVPEEPLLEHGAVDVAMGPQQRERVGSEPEPHGEPETAGVPVGTVTVRKMPEASYGPQRPISELTRAMRASLRNLDFGRPIREGTPEVGDDELLVEEVLVTEEVCVAEAKRRRKSEVSEQELARHEKENLHVSKAAEWNKMLETRSVKVHVGEAAEQLINEVGKDRLLSSRFVITRSDDAEKLKKGLVKARWCIRGYLDPDLLELDTAAPTLSPEGLAVVLQVLATKKWDLCIGDVEAAFLRGDDIERPRGRVLVRVPPGGIPGVPEGAVIELLKPVYGLADAPKAWHRSFTQALAKLGCVASKLDQCVYFCRSSDGVLQGIIALHVDDMACGGTQWFHDSVLRRLREAFPFKHFKKKAGDFLGRFLQQGEDFSIHVSQKEYAENLECIKVSRDRRKQRDAEVTEEERKQMRAALGELNWLVSSSRPDLAAFCSLLQQRVNKALVRDLIEVNRAVAMARDFCNMEVVVRHIPEQEVEFCVWSDASWANATEKKSQGGYVIAAVPSSLRKGSWATFSPLRWKSYKQDRQVASTLGAELLALSRALAEAKWVRSMWSEAMNANYTLETNDKWAVQIPITACLDSKPVYDHIHGQLMTIRDKRLAIEMLLVKQDVASDNVATRWMPTYQMLADSMTKCGAPMALLRRTIREGKTVLVEDDEIKRWAAKK
ncbi:GIP [Symbiodinium pilosum]|uniref:GIP protein n=1 Tax=Symbiodinium pilosum TaxID=2952 RepID=A0A812VDL4_SYMPI|nr:GIP [Symbiodinium pilosum]